MAKQTLPINFVDDILAQPMGGKRKFAITDNGDGTYSIEDVTEYTQIGSDFGASQMNQTNQAVNDSCDKADVIDDLDDIVANQAGGMIAGAKAVAELISKIPEEDNGYLKFVDGTLIQWGSDMTSNTNAVKVINLQIPFINNSYFVTYQFTRNANTVTRSWIGDAGGNEARTEDNFGIYLQRSSGTSMVYISWAAIGRWK